MKNLARLLLVFSLFAAPAFAADVLVEIKTDAGTITLALYPDKAPATVANFLGYVHRYYYDGLIFHRVMKGFVIQTGGYTYDLTRKTPGEPIVNESANGLKNRKGTVAMARLDDPDSATAQFFINLNDNRNLDPSGGKAGYTVFGRVVGGMNVVEKIAQRRVKREGILTHLPVKPVQILSVREIGHN